MQSKTFKTVDLFPSLNRLQLPRGIRVEVQFLETGSEIFYTQNFGPSVSVISTLSSPS